MWDSLASCALPGGYPGLTAQLDGLPTRMQRRVPKEALDREVQRVVERGSIQAHALAAGLAPLIVPRHVLGGPGYQAPSDTLTIAAVGIGAMGRNYLDAAKPRKSSPCATVDTQLFGQGLRHLSRRPALPRLPGDVR